MRTLKLVSWIALLLIMIVGVIALDFTTRGRAQEPTPSPTPIVIDQHFLVVPNVSPSDLQEEFKKLNQQGYTINRVNNLIVTGDKVTIIVSDDGHPASEEGE